MTIFNKFGILLFQNNLLLYASCISFTLRCLLWWFSGHTSSKRSTMLYIEIEIYMEAILMLGWENMNHFLIFICLMSEKFCVYHQLACI